MLRAESWEKIDAVTQRIIDDMIIACRADLKAAGFPAMGSRFPFGMHHEFYRVRIRVGRRRAQHAEVATVLNLWMATRADRTDYGRQALCGAVKSMLASRPELAGRIPPDVRAAMAAVGDGYDFLAFAKSAARASPQGLVAQEPESDRDEMVDELIDAVSTRA